MKNMQYKKSGATVSVSQEGTTQTYKIEREGKTLEMSFTRQQSTNSKTYTRSMSGGAGEAIKGDHIAKYDVGVKIGDEEKVFSTSVVAKHFDEWGKEVPNYEVDFEKGIPTQEYSALSEKLAEQNTAVAQVMNNYILNADDLPKCNNLQQSIFNQKLEDFLHSDK